MAELLPLGAAVAGGHCGGKGWGGGRRSGPGRELEAPPPHTHTFRNLSCILEVGAEKGSEQGRTGPTKASPWTERRG